MGANIVVNIFLSGVISLLCGALNNLTQLTILFLIGVPVHGAASTISKMILNFAQLQLLPADQINNKMWEFNDMDDPPLNTYFDTVGFSS